MIDVKELIRKYSVEELGDTAEGYYRSMDAAVLARKPFILPGLQHLMVEVSYLVYGLGLRPGDRVLDFGCGPGWASRMLNACGCEVVGVDVSQTAVDLATGLADRWRQAGLLDHDGPAIEFRRHDGFRIDVEDASIDKVFVLDAFHHVPDQAATLREFARVLKPGGMVGMCEPGPNHSRHPDSQREMALHKVVENDIVLDDIEVMARDAGLSDLKVCLSPLLPMMIDYATYKRFPNDPAEAQDFLATTDHRIKNYPLFFLRKAGIASLDSRGMEGLAASITLDSPPTIACRPGDTPEVRVTLANTGQATWLPSSGRQGAVNIGYTVTGRTGTTLHRTSASIRPVAPGEVVSATFQLPPMEPGRYEVEIDLVSEWVTWFKTIGGQVQTVRIDVG